MKMKRSTVVEAVNRLYKIHLNWAIDDVVNDVYSNDLPGAMKDVAAHAFMGDWKPCEDLDTLRSGMLQLKQFGYINNF